MKKFLLLIFAAGLAACGGRYGAGVSPAYEPLLDAVLAESPRADDLRQLLRETRRADRDAMAFLLVNMPSADRDTMRLDLLGENVEYACRARRDFPWAKALPDSVFLCEVLPYAVVDETRDAWRRDFFERFAPVVAGCPDLRSAAEAVNTAVRDIVGVEYNTAREKTNQSPAESIRQGMASCTGLSILLVDALRSVGIPARFVGTPAWHDDRGNHSWVEVFIDGEWHFTEYYYPGLDSAWFFADAGRATPGREHGIYAVSFLPTGDWFPMVWNEASHDVHGIDVTDGYVRACANHAGELLFARTHTTVTFEIYRSAEHAAASSDRVAVNVDVFGGTLQVGGGRTAGPQQDMNDELKFLLPKNGVYTFRYENARGEIAEVTAEVGTTPVTVRGYME